MLVLQQIDEILAGSLTQEDEEAVLAELEAITQVGCPTDKFISLSSMALKQCLILATDMKKVIM